MDVNFFVVGIAAITSFIVGSLWYSPALFGNRWMALTDMKPKNKKEEEEMKKKMGPAMIKSFGTSLVMAFVLYLLAVELGVSTMQEALTLGLWIWVGFIASVLTMQHVYSKDSNELLLLTLGHHLVAILAMCAMMQVLM